MPIANCVVTSECKPGLNSLIELWAHEAEKSSDHMTINIIRCSEQLGNAYKIMANLSLPSMWSAPDISSLQVGLARALSKHFSVAIEEVHVITHIVQSGFVVEAGQELEW